MLLVVRVSGWWLDLLAVWLNIVVGQSVVGHLVVWDFIYVVTYNIHIYMRHINIIELIRALPMNYAKNARQGR